MESGVFLKVIFHVDHQNNLIYHVQWKPTAEGKDETAPFGDGVP